MFKEGHPVEGIYLVHSGEFEIFKTIIENPFEDTKTNKILPKK